MNNKTEEKRMKIYASDKCFGIAGKAWAAIKEGAIVDVIPMNGCPYVKKADRRYKDGFKFIPGDFGEYRRLSRERLGELGEVISGVASCGEFIVV